MAYLISALFFVSKWPRLGLGAGARRLGAFTSIRSSGSGLTLDPVLVHIT